MSDRERSGAEDVEGHRRSRAALQDPEATDATETTTDDVEGHRVMLQDPEATGETQTTTQDTERRLNY
jgi:hypothetical protein